MTGCLLRAMFDETLWQVLTLYLGVVTATKPLVHVIGTLGVLAFQTFALSASAVSFLRWSVHGALHNIPTFWTLQQRPHESAWRAAD